MNIKPTKVLTVEELADVDEKSYLDGINYQEGRLKAQRDASDKAMLEQVVEWLNGDCEHYIKQTYNQAKRMKRVHCSKCRQELQKLAEPK